MSPKESRGLCSRCLFAAALAGGLVSPLSHGAGGQGALPRKFGPYELREEVARGGMGVVYRAWHAELDRFVAVKLLAGGFFAGPDFIARFQVEARAVAGLEHPNIVSIYEVGEQEGLPFFSMRFLEGGTLAQAQPFVGGEASPRSAAGLLVKLARAVHFAHQRGILHRDIKPGNVMLDGKGEPFLTDFGLAKLIEQESTLTHTMAMLGTPSYMSPEQARGESGQLTTAVDVYGLGAVLYELLTGQPPFAGGTTMETVRKVLGSEPRRPSALRRGLARDLETICLKCLAKNPAQRYESAEALAADLERWLRHEPIQARAAGGWEITAKWIRRHPGASAALMLAVAALLVITGGSIWFSLKLKAERDRADMEKERERRALARANTALAEAAYREQDGLGMQTALQAVPPSLRDTSWQYLMAHADTSEATWPTHYVGAAPDLTRPGVFAAAQVGGEIDIIQAGRGNIIQAIQPTPRQHDAEYQRGLAISADGTKLAVGGLNRGVITIYGLPSGQAVAEWDAPETDRLEFSPNGRWLLQSGNLGGAYLWEVAKRELAWTIPSLRRAVFRQPDAHQIIAVQGTNLVIVETANGAVDRRLCGLRANARALAVAPDGRMVVAGDMEGNLLGVSLLDDRVAFDHAVSALAIRGLDFTADGRQFVTASFAYGSQQQAIQVWNAETGTRLRHLVGGSSFVEEVHIHPLTDELLVTGMQTKSWDLSRQQPVATLPRNRTTVFLGEDACLGRSAAGAAVVTGESPPLGKVRWEMAGTGDWDFAVSANGRVGGGVLATGSTNQISILRDEGRKLVETCRWQEGARVGFIRLSPTGDRLLAFLLAGSCEAQLDTITGARLPRLADSPLEIRVTYDAAWLDGVRVVGAVSLNERRGTPGSAEALVLWDAPTGNIRRSARISALINCLSPAPDGQSFAEAGDDKMIRLRNARTLLIQQEFRAHDAAITALAWHPHRPILASAAADLTIKLWELPSGRCLQELQGPWKPVTMLNFSPDGRRLVSAGMDQTRIWEPKVLPTAGVAENR